jgi:hypothetical protein
MSISVEDADLLAALGRMSSTIARFTMPAAKATADNVVAEAQRRVARATGQTAEGITTKESRDGTGYVVLSDNARMPNLPLWIEFGTKQGKKGSHAEPARPYFFASAQLEAGAHDRRMRDAVQDAIDAEGLGV